MFVFCVFTNVAISKHYNFALCVRGTQPISCCCPNKYNTIRVYLIQEYQTSVVPKTINFNRAYSWIYSSGQVFMLVQNMAKFNL